MDDRGIEGRERDDELLNSEKLHGVEYNRRENRNGERKDGVFFNAFSGGILRNGFATRILKGLKFQYPNSAQRLMYPIWIHLTKGLNLVPDLAYPGQVPLELQVLHRLASGRV